MSKDQTGVDNIKVPLDFDQWRKITIQTPVKDHPGNVELQIFPLNTVGIVEILSIKFFDIAKKNVLCCVESKEEFDTLGVSTGAIRLPDKEKLILGVTGKESKVTVSIDEKLYNRQMKVEIWLKACKIDGITNNKQFTVLKNDNLSILVHVTGKDQLIGKGLNRPLNEILPESIGQKTIIEVEHLMRHRDIMLRTKKYAERCRYNLPTILVSYPRSGSNYLQNVLGASTKLYCSSLYSPRPKDPECVLSFKSHALSPKYLYDELNRYYPGIKPLSKIIWLKRDPRDVMVSFYEFLKYKKNIFVKQEEFLNGIDYDYAFVGDSNNVYSYLRKNETSPMSIADAYISHVKSWTEIKNSGLEILEIAYEDLVENPLESFNSIFQFLEIDATLNYEVLPQKVSLYSKESRKRGVPYGWKSNNIHTQLIEQVNEKLSNCITMLGYLMVS